jgi:dolichol-phosphate mannosyltransferase
MGAAVQTNNSPFRQTLKRYLRFGVVGAGGVVVDMAVLFVLSDPKMLAWNLSLGKALAAEVAIINNFLWNEFWTFGDLAAAQKNGRARLGRFFKFNLICLVGIGLSILLLNLQVRYTAMNVYLANLVAIVLVSFWNFGLNLKYGWKPAATGKPLKT